MNVGRSRYHLYINGQEIGSGESWYNTDVYTFDAPCDSPTVYAIDAYAFSLVAASANRRLFRPSELS